MSSAPAATTSLPGEVPPSEQRLSLETRTLLTNTLLTPLPDEAKADGATLVRRMDEIDAARTAAPSGSSKTVSFSVGPDVSAGGVKTAATAAKEVPKKAGPTPDDPKARAICIRQLQRYAEDYPREMKGAFPANYEMLSLDRLTDLVAACEARLEEGNEYLLLSAAIQGGLTMYESAIMPFVPEQLPHAHAYGVTQYALASLQDKRTPLADAVNRLSIKYMGLVSVGPWGALLCAMQGLVLEVGKMNLERGVPGTSAGTSAPEDDGMGAFLERPRSK